MDTLELVLDETLLDHTLPCKRCPTPAEWFMRCRNCGHRNSAFLCTPHKVKDEAEIVHVIKCGVCSMLGTLDEVFVCVPI